MNDIGIGFGLEPIAVRAEMNVVDDFWKQLCAKTAEESTEQAEATIDKYVETGATGSFSKIGLLGARFVRKKRF